MQQRNCIAVIHTCAVSVIVAIGDCASTEMARCHPQPVFRSQLCIARDLIMRAAISRLISPSVLFRLGNRAGGTLGQPANRMYPRGHLTVFFHLAPVCPPTNLACCCVTRNYISIPNIDTLAGKRVQFRSKYNTRCRRFV